ncbi:pre-B-cell leukemia transcription factor-interacting protein 1 isoform X2 [Ailuropoda melanoleuca]|uniref:pre-B-cell leukemia transcription factor-interacting protein 1 isoform X2 n=1 Tax=Ailuropoda melanoleuca TaxID=9646 RepID=UPI0014942094|nr:pre-B-cell leukemia transcription factor-interacting protein 1 isoform X2 [Ailuropoda melanoleuca]
MASCSDSDNSWVLAGSEKQPLEGSAQQQLRLGNGPTPRPADACHPPCLSSPLRSLPVETLGPESMVDAELESTPQALGSPSKTAAGELAGAEDGGETVFQGESAQSGPVLPEKTEAEDDLEGHGCAGGPLGLGDTLVQGDSDEALVAAGLGPDTEDPEDQSPQGSLPSSPSAAWSREETRCSSSEDDTDMDVEGLRRRRGREPSAPQPVGTLGVEDQAGGEGAGWELGISLNLCLLGALVLLGLGIFLFSGPVEEVEQVFPDTGLDMEVRDAAGDGQDGAPGLSDSVPSLQSMALLLDRLAKENQDIRLLQAQLQAQKEELQSLMQQPQELAEENARLRGALRRGESSQRALQSELQQLRARLQGLEAECVRGPDGVCSGWGTGSQGGRVTEERGPREQEPGPGFLEQKERLEAEAWALRQELERQRQLLGSVQQDLEQSLGGAGRGDPARAGLTELGHRLTQKLQGLEKWGQHPGVRANASEARFQSSREGSGKEKRRDGPGDRSTEPWKHKKEGSGWERKKSWQGEDRELAGRGKEEGKPWEGKRGSKKDGKRQGPKEPPRKSGSPRSSADRQKHPQWKEGAKDGHEPLPLWAGLSRHRYRAPQGCSGVHECARQEGLAFGVELVPVRHQELASLLTTYLARLPWAGQLTKELPLLPAYFGEDGIFRHDRLRFRDFVDALEDSLEEVAVRQTGDDDEVDDFESFIFSHFFGDKALKKRSGKKGRHLRNPGRG